jgi:hypothetical protein
MRPREEVEIAIPIATPIDFRLVDFLPVIALILPPVFDVLLPFQRRDRRLHVLGAARHGRG